MSHKTHHRTVSSTSGGSGFGIGEDSSWLHGGRSSPHTRNTSRGGTAAHSGGVRHVLWYVLRLLLGVFIVVSGWSIWQHAASTSRLTRNAAPFAQRRDTYTVPSISIKDKRDAISSHVPLRTISIVEPTRAAPLKRLLTNISPPPPPPPPTPAPVAPPITPPTDPVPASKLVLASVPEPTLAPIIEPTPAPIHATVLASPASPIPAVTPAAAPLAAPVVPTPLSGDMTPFTVFSILRDMDMPNSTDTTRYSIQLHALRSWQLLVGGPAFNSRLIVFMDSIASCNSLLAIQPPGEINLAFNGVRCLPIPCWHAEFKRPLMNCLFETAHQIADTELVLYVNGDIILNPALGGRLERVIREMAAKKRDRFLAVARRIDVTLLSHHIIGPEAPLPDTARLNELVQHAKATGTVHGEYGLDIFFYTKNIFSTPSLRDFPPYIAGVFRWDNWFLAECILRNDIDTIDLTPLWDDVHQHDAVDTGDAPAEHHHAIVEADTMLVHQDDPVSLQHRTRVGSVVNEHLAHVRSGRDYKFGCITNCKWRLAHDTHQGPCDTPESHVECPLRLELNSHRHLSVQFRLVATQQDHFFVIPVLARTFQAAYFTNFLCFVRRHRMRHFVLVVDDEALATSLREEMKALFADPAIGLTEHEAFVYVMPHTDVATRAEGEKLQSLTPLHELLPESALTPRTSGVLAAEDGLLHRLEFEAFYFGFLRQIVNSGFSPIHLDLLSATYGSEPSSSSLAGQTRRVRGGVVLTGGSLMDFIEVQAESLTDPPLNLMYTRAHNDVPPPDAPTHRHIKINPSVLLVQRSSMGQYFLALVIKCAAENLGNFLATHSDADDGSLPAGGNPPPPSVEPSECFGLAFKKLHSSRLVKHELDPRHIRSVAHEPTDASDEHAGTVVMRLDDTPFVASVDGPKLTPAEAEAEQIQRWTKSGGFFTAQTCPPSTYVPPRREFASLGASISPPTLRTQPATANSQ